MNSEELVQESIADICAMADIMARADGFGDPGAGYTVVWPHNPPDSPAVFADLLRRSTVRLRQYGDLLPNDAYQIGIDFLSRVRDADAACELADRSFFENIDSIAMETAAPTRCPGQALETMRRLFSDHLEDVLIALRGGRKSKADEEIACPIPKERFDDDIVRILELTYQEIVICYLHNCYLAAISLCGKFLETVLTDLYRIECGGDAEEEKLGYNAIVNRLNQAGYNLNKDSILYKMNIINTHRNKAIHGNLVIPTPDEAKAVILLTKDVLLKIAARTETRDPGPEPIAESRSGVS